MPEAPEIKLFVEALEPFFGSTLKSIDIISGKYKKTKPKNYSAFIKHLPAKIDSIQNKGKFIWISLGQSSIWITLGLTGELLTTNNTYNHVAFITTKGTFYFSDMRNFGTIIFSTNAAELLKKLHSLGDDIMTANPTDLAAKFHTSVPQNNIIGLALVNQRWVSGIGNYLRAEILYLARISPFRKLHNITDKELLELFIIAKKEANTEYRYIKKHGLYNNRFKVYQQKITPDGEPVLHEKINGRMMWWVPTVQK